MTKPARLSIVPTPKPSFDERSIARMGELRDQLMAAAVHFVRKGKGGSVPERVRISSDTTGIPRGLIEAEMRK